MSDDHARRLERLEAQDLQTAGQLAANTVLVEALSDKLTAGLDQISERLDQLAANMTAHASTLQSLSEARARQAGVMKWGAGVAAAVAAGAVLVGLGLK